MQRGSQDQLGDSCTKAVESWWPPLSPCWRMTADPHRDGSIALLPAHDPHIYALETNQSLCAKAAPAPDAPAGCRSRRQCGTARGVAAPAQPAPQNPQGPPAATAASG